MEAIDPLGSTGTIYAEIERYLAFVKSARPVEPGGEVLIPGEPEERMRAERLACGVPLTDDTWASIVGTACAAGVPDTRIPRGTV
jgi:hydroxycarboxylate dehydrogenase B